MDTRKKSSPGTTHTVYDKEKLCWVRFGIEDEESSTTQTAETEG